MGLFFEAEEIRNIMEMFKVGDFVIYGSSGACRISEVGPIDFPGADQEKIYYTMTPCYIRDSSIFTPVDNRRVVLRSVMTKDEADHFLDHLGEIRPLKVEEEKKREIAYKQALLTCEPKQIVSLIKTINARIAQRTAEGKKVTSADMKYIHIAEDSLYGELAISLGMEREEVEPYVKAKLGKAG